MLKNLLRMAVKVKLADFFADLSTNAMGTETKIQALAALLDGSQSGIEIDGTLCKSEDDIRKLLEQTPILKKKETEKEAEKGGEK